MVGVAANQLNLSPFRLLNGVADSNLLSGSLDPADGSVPSPAEDKDVITFLLDGIVATSDARS